MLRNRRAKNCTIQRQDQFSPFDLLALLRAFAITHKRFIGRTLSQLAVDFPEVPVLRVVRDGKVLDLSGNPKVQVQVHDIVTVRADVHSLIQEEGELIGPESDDPLARNVPVELADRHVGAHQVSGKSLAELGHAMAGGLPCRRCFAEAPNCRSARKAPFKRSLCAWDFCGRDHGGCGCQLFPQPQP